MIVRIVVRAPIGGVPYQVDAVVLNAAIAVALLGKQWTASHNAHEAIVDCDEADEATVRSVIQAHIDSTALREARAVIDAQIRALEAKVTARTLRETALGIGASRTRLEAIDNQIATLRSQRP